MEIIEINIDQLCELQNLSISTFRDTYSASNSKENTDQHIETNFSQEKLSLEILNPNSRFYFAIENGEEIGYLKINWGNAQTEKQDLNALEIERIYIKKDHQGKKIGNQLLQKAIEVAIEKKATYVWLGVWNQNQKAVEFYKKSGFSAFDKHMFLFGAEKQTDIMMKYNI